MDFVLARGSSLGLYARKNAIPTLTLNDVKDVLNGFRSSAASIYSSASVSKSQRDARSLVRYENVIKPPMKIIFHQSIPTTVIMMIQFNIL